MTYRLVRSISAGVALLVLVAGVPVMLVIWGRSPLDGQGSTLEQIQALPTESISDNVVFGTLTVAAWIAWALFTVHVVIELAGAFGAAVRWRLPAFGPMQLGARRLVTALTMAVTISGPFGQRAGAVPDLPSAASSVSSEVETIEAPSSVRPSSTPPTSRPSSAETALPYQLPDDVASSDVEDAADPAEPVDKAGADVTDGPPVVTVAAGDTPWGLAERHLGRGVRWREIWDLNSGRPQPGGQAWVSEDLIHPGWRFRLPADAINVPALAPTSGQPDEPSAPEGPQEHLESTPEPSDTNDPPVSPTTTAPEVDASTDLEEEPSLDAEAGQGDTSNVPTAPEDARQNGDNRSETEPTTTTTAETTSPDTRPSTPETETETETNRTEGTADGSDADEDDGGSSRPVAPFLGVAGTLLAVAVVRELRRRRTRRAVQRPVDAVPPPAPRVPVDRELFDRADDQVADRLDSALAQLAGSLRSRPRGECVQPRLVQVSGDRIEVCMDRADPAPPRPWRPDASGMIWVLDADQPLEPIDAVTPLPSLVTIGVGDADILIDLEAHGVVALVGDEEVCRRMARSIVAELSTRAEGAVATTIVGDVLEESSTSLDGVHSAPSWDDLDTSTISTSVRLLDAGRWPHTWAARASGQVFDGWAPAVWVSSPSEDPRYLDTVEAISARPGAGSAIVVVGGDPGRGLRIHLDANGEFDIPDLGLQGDAQLLDAEVTDQLIELLDDVDTEPASNVVTDITERLRWNRHDSNDHEETETDPHDDGEEVTDNEGLEDEADLYPLDHEPAISHEEGDEPTPSSTYNVPSYQDPPWDVLVRLCGPIRIEGGRSDLPQRETAVASYIALHGETDLDRIIDAVWAGAGVSHKRCQNVISVIRGSVRDAITWTPDHRLTTGPGLVTDLELLQRRLDYATHQDLDYQVETLQGALDYVTGPVCGFPRRGRRAWTWLETDDWISHIERIVGTVASRLAAAYLELGDSQEALQAAEKGIGAVGKRDELVILQVRAHEQAGDFASARGVIRSYEHYLNSLGVDEFNEELLQLLDRYGTPARTKTKT